MPQATLDTRDDTQIVGWEGLLVPYGVSTTESEQRIVESPPELRMRTLPMFMGYQERTSAGHDNAKTGLLSITRVWETPEGMWGSGPFDLADAEAVELARKTSLGFAGWVSVDIEPLDYEPRTDRTGRLSIVYKDWRIAGATLVANSAYNEARIFTITDPSRITPAETVIAEQRKAYGVDEFAHADHRATQSIMLTFSKAPTHTARKTVRVGTFTLTGDVDLPWAPRERDWDGDAAARRVQEWADGDPERMERAFLWRDTDADPTTQAAYSLGFADVIDGELRAVYRGLAAAAGRLDQTDIPTDDRGRIQSRINTLYERAAAAFDDPDIAEGDESMADEETVTFQDEGAPSGALTESQIDQVLDAVRPVITEMIDAALAERDAEDVEAADIQDMMAAQMARMNTLGVR